MELQKRSYSCGPAALRSALYVHGKEATEAAIRRWAGTTTEGTDEAGLKRAIAHYKFRDKEFQTESVREAFRILKTELRKGNPVLLCTEQWGHWISIVGILGKKIIVFDPAKKRNGRLRYSGLRYYTMSDLAGKWGYLEPSGLTSYYGMIILPRRD